LRWSGFVPRRADGRDSGSIQSVDRAVALLKAFTVDEPEIGVTELARRLRLHKSTVSRLLAALQRGGLVQQDGQSGKYRLGFHLVELAGRVLTQIDLRQIAQPHIQELALASQETVNLGVLYGDEVVNIDQIISPRPIKHMGWIGRRNPLHCTAGGRAVLAHLPPTEIDRLVAQPLARMTWRTCVDPVELRQELERIRARGYSISEEEFEEGLSAVAAPIRDFSGRVVAVVSISGPAFRLSAAKVIAYGGIVREGATKISRELGYQSDDRPDVAPMRAAAT
jgi:DNA-binding IclR family transcriptional regulator